MKANTYKVLARAVEEGVLVGWNRAHKHTDNPTDDQIKFQLIESVLNEICEWMDFDEDKGE